MSEKRPHAIEVGDILFRLALRILPAEFRTEYGSEIYAFHRARLEEGHGSKWGRRGLWVQAILDVFMGGVRERGRGLRRAWSGGGVGSPRGKADVPGSGGRREGPSWGTRFDFLIQDLRYATRSLIRQGGFTAVSVFSLAVGIGLFAGFFSLVQESWLRPVPGVNGAEEVVELTVVTPNAELESWAYPDFRDLRAAQTPLQELAGLKEREWTLATADGGEPVRMMSVSANYFRVLGVTPMSGRGFLPSEDAGPGQNPVAVVGYGMWQNRLGGDPEIVGRTLVLNRTPYTVVGVAPEEFKGHRTLVPETEIWVPLTQDPWVAGTDGWTEDRDALWLRVLGRLRSGASLEEANAAIETIFTRLEEEHPQVNEGRRARAHPFGPIPAVSRAGSFWATILLAGLLGLVLVIISGNVAGMVLARSVTREQELAVRLALGSGRGRIARLLFVEAALLAGAGGVGGVFLGIWGLEAAYAMIPGMPEMSFQFGGPLLPALGVVILGTGLLVGVLPALRFSRPELVSSLKEAPGGSGRRAGRIHRFAASAQTGVAFTLLVVCGLFVRALGVLDQKDLGFEPAGLLTTRMDLSNEGLESQEMAELFMDRVREAVAAVPGVSSVALADGIPLDLVGNFTGVARLDQPDDVAGRVTVEFTKVGGGFFENIGTSILRGRGIEATDDQESELVMVITESLATRLWPGEEAVGRRVRSGMSREGPREFTVVGVVEEVASSRAAESWPNIFVSLKQNYTPRVMVVIRGPEDPGSIYRSIQNALVALDDDLPFPVIVSSESLVSRAGSSQRISAGAAGALGALALLLAAIGIYGVVAFAVSRRTKEIGLRMAMGASRGEVLSGVMKDALRLSVPGLAVGALLAGGVAAVFRAELFGLSPVDPASFLGGAFVLFLVILLASLFPARRASGIDPMMALRRE
jgi:predicted permease